MEYHTDDRHRASLKPDKVKQLEKGLKDHTDKFHQSAEHLVHTWEVVAGERTGQYMRNGPTQSWADFDANFGAKMALIYRLADIAKTSKNN